MKARGPGLSLGDALQQLGMLGGPEGEGWVTWVLILAGSPAPAADTSSFHPAPWAVRAEGNVDTSRVFEVQLFQHPPRKSWHRLPCLSVPKLGRDSRGCESQGVHLLTISMAQIKKGNKKLLPTYLRSRQPVLLGRELPGEHRALLGWHSRLRARLRAWEGRVRVA